MAITYVWLDCLDCEHQFKISEARLNKQMETVCPKCDSVMLFVRVTTPKERKSSQKKTSGSKKWRIKEKGKLKKKIKKTRRSKK